MALNLIEKVAAPPTKTDSRERKRSDESGSGTGTPSGSGPPNPCSARHSEPQGTVPGILGPGRTTPATTDPVPDMGATRTTLRLSTCITPGVEPDRCPAGARPVRASTALRLMVAEGSRATPAAAAGAPGTGACLEGGTGRGGNNNAIQPTFANTFFVILLPSNCHLFLLQTSCNNYTSILPYIIGNFDLMIS
jgi:hypothetical protein